MGNPGKKGRGGNKHLFVWGVAGAIALGSLGYVMFGPSSTATSTAQGTSAITTQMTDFEGQTFALSDYRGKPVVVNFWASWCPSCVAEMPDFEVVYQNRRAEVEFVGINQSDSRERADELADETGVSYRLAEDPDGRIFEAFGGVGMPTTVFINADGDIVDVVVGQLSAEHLEELIDQSFPPADNV